MATLSLSSQLRLPAVQGMSADGGVASRLSPFSSFASSVKKGTLSIQSRRVTPVARAADVEGSSVDVAAKEGGGKESVDVLPSGEWAHNFSMLNYEDLQTHYEKKEQGPAPQGPYSPILPDGSHGVVSGEWYENFGLLSYEDLSSYFQQQIFKQDAKPDSMLAEIMKTKVRTAYPFQPVGDIKHHFESVSGIVVVDEELKCMGTLSREDAAKAGSDSVLVKDVMTSPAVATLTPDKTVLFAAVIMLKNKVHRIPVLNQGGQLVGIVTRTDIFTALEDAK